MSVDLQNEIRQAINGGEGPTTLTRAERAISQRILEEALTRAGPVVDSTAASEATGAIAAALTIIDLPVLLAAIGFAIILIFLRDQLAHILGKIPFSIGGKLVQLVHLAFSPVDTLEQWIVGSVAGLTQTLMPAIMHFLGWSITQTTHVAAPNIAPIVERILKPVHDEVNELWHWVSNINAWVTHIWHMVEYHTYLHDTTSNTLVQTVNFIQTTNADTTTQLQTIHQQIGTLFHEVQQMQHDFTQLREHVTGVRAVNVGFQDITTSITNLQAEITGLQAVQQAQIGITTGQLAGLMPLAVLLEAGEAGLRNLRKLEDNPCQCPRLPHFGNELGTALSLIEFIENG